MRNCDQKMMALWSRLPSRLVDSLANQWAGLLDLIPRTTFERGDDSCAVGGSDHIAATALLLATLPADRLRPFLNAIGDAIIEGRLPRESGGSGRIWIEELMVDQTAGRARR